MTRLIVLENDKQRLHDIKAQTVEFLSREFLFLHLGKAMVYRTLKGVDVLGYHVFPDFKLVRNDNGYRFSRKLRGMAKAYQQGTPLADFDPSVQSWIGHAMQADTWGLRNRIFSSVVFTRSKSV